MAKKKADKRRQEKEQQRVEKEKEERKKMKLQELDAKRRELPGGEGMRVFSFLDFCPRPSYFIRGAADYKSSRL